MARRTNRSRHAVDDPARRPQHQIVADDLLRLITDGTYAVGARLPTESELCESYGLSRGTVRQALGQLRQLGMIERRPSTGTIVVSAEPVGPYRSFAHSQDDIVLLAETTRLTRRESFDVVVDSALARRLGARTGSTWHLIRGVRVSRSQPDLALCWSEHFLRGDIPREKQLGSFRRETFSQYVVEQIVSAERLDASVALALNAEPDSPALVVTRRLRDRAGKVLNVGVHTHPGDRYTITTTVGPDH
ncbi:MAG: GntR family transcriptional regulator [Acidimicrobiales bacterium]